MLFEQRNDQLWTRYKISRAQMTFTQTAQCNNRRIIMMEMMTMMMVIIIIINIIMIIIIMLLIFWPNGLLLSY
jgi:hypothetical protein